MWISLTGCRADAPGKEGCDWECQLPIREPSDPITPHPHSLRRCFPSRRVQLSWCPLVFDWENPQSPVQHSLVTRGSAGRFIFPERNSRSVPIHAPFHWTSKPSTHTLVAPCCGTPTK